MYFQVADGYLVLATEPEAMQRGRAFVETLRRTATYGAQSEGAPVHGSFLVQGAELAKLIRASRKPLRSSSYECLCEAIAGAAHELESFRMDIRYQRDAIGLHGRMFFGVGPQ